VTRTGEPTAFGTVGSESRTENDTLDVVSEEREKEPESVAAQNSAAAASNAVPEKNPMAGSNSTVTTPATTTAA